MCCKLIYRLFCEKYDDADYHSKSFDGGFNGNLYKHKTKQKCVKICSTNMLDNGPSTGNKWKKMAKLGLAPALYEYGDYEGTKYNGSTYIVMEWLDGARYEKSKNPNKKQLALQLIEKTIANKIIIDVPLKQEIFITNDGIAKWTDIELCDNANISFDEHKKQLEELYNEINND